MGYEGVWFSRKILKIGGKIQKKIVSLQAELFTSEVVHNTSTSRSHRMRLLQTHLMPERGQNCFQLACKGVIHNVNLLVTDAA
jgi:hypothetical protein